MPASIRNYFRPELHRRALEAYGRFATSRPAWSVGEKMSLYALARVAFASQVAEDERFAAFQQIHDTLWKLWKVFRSSRQEPGEVRWTDREIYDNIVHHFKRFSRGE